MVTTTLTSAVGLADGAFSVGTTVDVRPGMAYTVDGEIGRVLSVGIGASVIFVRRGTDGTAASAHNAASPLLIGLPELFTASQPSVITGGISPSRSAQVVGQDGQTAISIGKASY